LPESRFELQHSGSPFKETALEEKAEANFLGRSIGAGGVGGQEMAEAARTELWAGRGAIGRARPLLDDIHSKIEAVQSAALPSSALSKACQYALGLWKKLTHFLEYPELELSTNLAENSMRRWACVEDLCRSNTSLSTQHCFQCCLRGVVTH
jgi:Transposase IS66 family